MKIIPWILTVCLTCAFLHPQSAYSSESSSTAQELPLLSLKLVDSLDIPGFGSYIEMIHLTEDRMYVCAPSDYIGISCYSIPDFNLLWGKSLSTRNDLCPDEVFRTKQIAPDRICVSDDGRLVFVARHSGCWDLYPYSVNICVLDTNNGEIISSLNDIDGILSLYSGKINGEDALIAVNNHEIRLLDAYNLNNELLYIEEEAVDVTVDSPVYFEPLNPYAEFPDIPAIGESIYIKDTQTLYCILSSKNQIAMYQFVSDNGEIEVERTTFDFDSRVSGIETIDDEIAIAFNIDGKVSFCDPVTLEERVSFTILPFSDNRRQDIILDPISRMKVINDLLFIGSLEREEITDAEGNKDCHYFNVLQVIDPSRGLVSKHQLGNRRFNGIFAIKGERVLVYSNDLHLESLSLDRLNNLRQPTAQGDLWVLDTNTYELVGHMEFIKGCPGLAVIPNTNIFVTAQYTLEIHDQSYSDSWLEDRLLILEIE